MHRLGFKMKPMKIIYVFFTIFLSLCIINGSKASFTVMKVSSVKEATFNERFSNSLPDTEYHECNVPERDLEICAQVTSKNEFCNLHDCKFIEGKPMEKKKRFHVRQDIRRGAKNVVLSLCKCPAEPSIYIQDNVYSNDVTVFIDTSQVSD